MLVRSGSAAIDGPGAALGATGDHARDVQVGGRRGAAGQDERVELGQVLVELVAPALEPLDLALGDAQRRVLRVLDHRGGEVGAHVEEVVLDLAQRGDDRLRRRPDGERDADRGVRLLRVGVGREPRVGLGHAREVRQARRPVVAGARVDPGQVYGHGPPWGPGVQAIGRCGADGSVAARWNEHFVVRGGGPLSGAVDVVGAKNSVLKLMAAALLAEGGPS